MIRKICLGLILVLLVLAPSYGKGNRFLSFVYGYSPLTLHDFNDHVNSLNSMLNSIYENFPPVGQLEKSIGLAGLDKANSFESEMRTEIGRQFELGLLFTYFQAQRTSESSVVSGSYEVLAQMSTKMTVLNPNLVLYYYVPFSRWLFLEFSVGGGYYYARVPFSQLISFYHPDLFGQPNFFYQQAVNTNLSSHGLGALAGITFEVRFFSTIGILFGARYRYVQMGKISGSGTLEDTNTPLTEIDKGVLYYYLDQDLANELGGEYPLLRFSADEPVGLTGLREARLELSGYTLLVGIRVWF